MPLKLEVKSSRLIVVDPTLQGRPPALSSSNGPASAKDAPKSGVKNRGKIGDGGAGKRLPLGLGDAVERVAKPIALRHDALNAWGARRLGLAEGKKLAGCSACSWRRRMLNQIVPDVRSRGSWAGAWGRLKVVWRARRKRLKAGKTSA